jgi:hypothetical protein
MIKKYQSESTTNKLILKMFLITFFFIWIIYAFSSKNERIKEFEIYQENLYSFVQKEVSEKVVMKRISDYEYKIIYKEGTVVFSISNIFYCNSFTKLQKNIEFPEKLNLKITKEKSSYIINTYYNDICIDIHLQQYLFNITYHDKKRILLFSSY